MHQRTKRLLVIMTLSALNALGPGRAAITAAEPDAIVNIMERVADWQLANPIGFDIYYTREGDSRRHLLRVGWNGALLRTRTYGRAAPAPDGIPDAWRQLARIERDGVSFCALPAATQAAWLKETGLAPGAITRIEMLDGATRGWEMGALYHGLLALDTVSKKRIYRDALREIGEANAWRLGERVYHADDHIAGYMYLAFYERDKNPLVIAGVQSRFDWIMRHAPAQPMTILRGQHRWTWCDALFMAAPVWARLARVTGDRAYLDHMDREWWAATAHLYAPDEHLFFRDATFFDRREANGAKIFWSRGNAWVLAALARVLDEMPADYPSRENYIALYRDMAARIAALKPAGGLWRASLLDRSAYPGPEVSSSAFFCYAFAWGINNGHLDRTEYEPLVLKTWDALAACVQPDGHLGYIQQPGAAPGSAAADSTAPYGVGAFLLAGVEVSKLSARW